MDGVRSLIGFIADNTSGILERTIEHATIVLGVMLVATVFSVVLGIAVQNRGLAKQVSLGTAGVLLTIPSLALFAIFIPLVGIGNRPAQIALFLYAILPILRNTVTGLDAVDPAIVEAAQGMGMGQFHQLVRVRIPLAWPVIIAGVRVSTQLITGVAAIAVLVVSLMCRSSSRVVSSSVVSGDRGRSCVVRSRRARRQGRARAG